VHHDLVPQSRGRAGRAASLRERLCLSALVTTRFSAHVN
jgi:hypothetical protein